MPLWFSPSLPETLLKRGGEDEEHGQHRHDKDEFLHEENAQRTQSSEEAKLAQTVSQELTEGTEKGREPASAVSAITPSAPSKPEYPSDDGPRQKRQSFRYRSGRVLGGEICAAKPAVRRFRGPR